jgi:hypothetical protein
MPFPLNKSFIPVTLTLLLPLFIHQSAFAQEKQSEGWTDTSYPDYITKVTNFGERPDWSHDGKRFLFVERSFGDVYEYKLETGKYKPLTYHYYHGGYARALCPSNGDILLSGTRDFPGENWMEARFRLAELWVLDKDLDKPPTRLGEYCWEGPAASRTQLRISWAQHHGLYPENIRHYELYVGNLDYSSGEAKIINQRVVLDNSKGAVKDKVLEQQESKRVKELSERMDDILLETEALIPLPNPDYVADGQ